MLCAPDNFSVAGIVSIMKEVNFFSCTHINYANRSTHTHVPPWLGIFYFINFTSDGKSCMLLNIWSVGCSTCGIFVFLHICFISVNFNALVH